MSGRRQTILWAASFCFASWFSGVLRAADKAPEWVAEAHTRALPAYGSDVRYATLLDESEVTVLLPLVR